jgi:hypothetical protein
MHPGRILGLIMGLVILLAIFLLPFTSQTLYSTLSPMLSNMAAIQAGGPQLIAMDYVLVIVFILLVLAGFVGIFPLGTGVIGVVAMAMYTLGPILVYPSLAAPAYGTGYYVVWVASIVSLAASFWHRRARRRVMVVNNPPPTAG